MIRFVRLCIILALDITYALFLKADRLSCPVFYVFRAFSFNIRLFYMFPPENSQALFYVFSALSEGLLHLPFFRIALFFPAFLFPFSSFPRIQTRKSCPFVGKKKAHLIMMCFLKFSGTFQSFKGSNLMSI